MSNFENKYWELSFNSVSEKLFNNLKEGEYLIIQLTAEKVILFALIMLKLGKRAWS